MKQQVLSARIHQLLVEPLVEPLVQARIAARARSTMVWASAMVGTAMSVSACSQAR